MTLRNNHTLSALCCVFIMALGMAMPHTALTEENAVTDNPETLLFMEISIASKFMQKESEAPSIVSVIPAKQLRSYGWLSVNDVLQKQPGFTLSRDYDRTTVSSRGLLEGWNNNHLLFLVDGVPFNDDLYGTAYTGDITPLFFVNSIEIIRGPGSALYGSNATNGVINLKTLTVNDLDEKSSVRVRAGDHGTRIYDVITGKAGGKCSLVAGFSGSQTDGNEYDSCDASGRTDASGNLQKFRTNDSRDSTYGFVKLDGNGSLSGLSVQYHTQAWDFETGHGWIFQIPDFAESMKESRQMLALQYNPVAVNALSQEYVVRYQRHAIDWNQRYMPNGTPGYPAGLWEYLNTKAEDLFSRVQFTYKAPNKASIVAGVEGTVFMYSGDHEHYSNVDINTGGTLLPTTDNSMMGLKPWLEYIKNNPLINYAPYIQFVSGSLLGDTLKLTAGVRYDCEMFSYTDIADANMKKSKSFNQTNPRIALVYLPRWDLSFKALCAMAFRAPSPTELFGANTYSLASNINDLKPEIVTTSELASDWQVTKNIIWKINGFHTRYENQIAYSGTNNLSANIYTLTTVGLETELNYSYRKISGFLNYSYAQRQDEEIIDPTVAMSKTTLTWVPTHSINAGIAYELSRLTSSLQGHYQGEVLRRSSDMVSTTNAALRPDKIAPWVSVDLNCIYQVVPNVTLELKATNLFDQSITLIKNHDFPFDYQQEGRRLLASIQVTF